MAESESPPKDNRLRRWLKRIGLAGFLFFLVKGLIWLGVFAGVGALFAC